MLASLQLNALSRGPNDLSHVSFKDRISYSGPGHRHRRWPLTTNQGLCHPLEALDYLFGVSPRNMADTIVLIHLLLFIASRRVSNALLPINRLELCGPRQVVVPARAISYSYSLEEMSACHYASFYEIENPLVSETTSDTSKYRQISLPSVLAPGKSCNT